MRYPPAVLSSYCAPRAFVPGFVSTIFGKDSCASSTSAMTCVTVVRVMLLLCTPYASRQPMHMDPRSRTPGENALSSQPLRSRYPHLRSVEDDPLPAGMGFKAVLFPGDVPPSLLFRLDRQLPNTREFGIVLSSPFALKKMKGALQVTR